MAFVRQRKLKSDGVSTALVEAYRDANGRPRQRLLANLYGAATPLEALAKIAAQRERLRKEKGALESEMTGSADYYKAITGLSTHGHRFSPAERKDIDRFLSARGRVIKRLKIVDAALARIQKNGGVIKKHCDASPAEVQAAIRRYKKQLDDAETMILGAAFYLDQVKQAKRELRRLSPFSTRDMEKELKQILRDLPL